MLTFGHEPTVQAANPRLYLCAERHTRQLLPLKCAATDLRVCLLLSFTVLLLFTLVLFCCVPLCVCVLISVCALSYHSHWIYPILFALVHLCVLCILMSTEFQHCLFSVVLTLHCLIDFNMKTTTVLACS